MIGIKLSGGLGNNLFEYASARSLAEYKKVRFCYFPKENINFYIKKIKKFILFKFFGKKELFKKQISKKDLSNYFNLDKKPFDNFINKILWSISFEKKIKYYDKKYNSKSDKQYFKKNIDKKEIIELKNWTELVGCFASENYFIEREQILKWFTPKDFYKRKIDMIEKKFHMPSKDRCCIHIRRGDALYMDKGLQYKGLGWSLPEFYYKYLIKKLGLNLLYIFLSDDPDWVQGRFDYLPNKIILKGNSEIIDIFIFSKCRINILSRGTFSWWGAWLNQIPNKEIYAPKYFLGIPERICVPHGMDKGKEVENWNYIDVDEIKDKII